MKFRSIAIAAAVMGVCGASAQLPGLGGVGLRAGVFFPDGDSWAAFGVDYPIMSLGVPATPVNTHLFLSADFMSEGGNRSIPVMANVGVRVSGLRPSVGIGFGFNRRAGGSESTDLTMQVGLAYDVTSLVTPIFIEGKYWRSEDGDFSGFGLYVGVRF